MSSALHSRMEARKKGSFPHAQHVHWHALAPNRGSVHTLYADEHMHVRCRVVETVSANAVQLTCCALMGAACDMRKPTHHMPLSAACCLLHTPPLVVDPSKHGAVGCCAVCRMSSMARCMLHAGAWRGCS